MDRPASALLQRPAMAPQATSAFQSLDSRSTLQPLTEVPASPGSSVAAVESPTSGPVSLVRETEASAAALKPALDDDWPTLAVLSRRYIGRALEHTSGNKTRAADLLGIDRRTLNRILARERAKQAAAKNQANGAPQAR